jgi:uncharacterized lipoprotein NlpE involved in copper resistance
MNFKYLTIILFSFAFFNACNQCSNEETIEVEEADTIFNNAPSNANSQNSLDWAGTYEGTTPCTDCGGIEESITINNDLTYTSKSKYIKGKDGKTFESKGSFNWNENGSIITINNSENAEKKIYKVVSGRKHPIFKYCIYSLFIHL